MFDLIGGGVVIHDMHVVNTVRPVRPEVSNEETPLQTPLVFLRVTFEFLIPSMHGTTCLDFGISMNVCGCEGLAHKVSEPITDFVLMQCDEASLLAVERA